MDSFNERWPNPWNFDDLRRDLHTTLNSAKWQEWLSVSSMNFLSERCRDWIRTTWSLTSQLWRRGCHRVLLRNMVCTLMTMSLRDPNKNMFTLTYIEFNLMHMTIKDDYFWHRFWISGYTLVWFQRGCINA